MNSKLTAFVDELFATGVAYDATQPDRHLRWRNLAPATAALLGLTARIAGARRIVEVGTSNAYSTIWLADAACDTDGSVVSVDTVQSDAAAPNLARADAAQPGLGRRVELRQEDGGRYLASLADGSVDFLFLDAERVEYPHWWPHPVRVLRPGGVLAIDNALSHADELAPFLALLAGEPAVRGATIVPIGNGLHLSWRGA
ncbi:MAG: class I SAM-dependent methyltransferase [Holophagales bacterium]|nr:MAG: class I SAM-dependent methyltransferase [Holophagales bacterium]